MERAATPTGLDRTRFFIGGASTAPRGSPTHRALDAATEELLCTAASIDAAARAARHALDEGPCGRSIAADRAAVMLRFADTLAARAGATSVLASRENGVPIITSTAFDGATPLPLLRLYADLITCTPREEVRPRRAGATMVRREPVAEFLTYLTTLTRG